MSQNSQWIHEMENIDQNKELWKKVKGKEGPGLQQFVTKEG